VSTQFDGPVSRATTHRRLGDFNTDLGRLDIALNAYTTALAAAPSDVSIRLSLGNLHLRANDLDEAVDAFSRVLEAVPGEPSALHGLAEVYRRQGDFESALDAATRVLDHLPDHRGALYIRGNALVRLGRRDEGSADLDRYLQVQTEAQTAERQARRLYGIRTEGTMLIVDGRYNEAISVFQAGIAEFPEAADLHLGLGDAQSESGRHDDAIASFLSMLDAGVGDPAQIHIRLELEYGLNGDPEAAARHRALAANPGITENP